MSRASTNIDFTKIIRDLQTQQASVREEELARHAQLMDFASNLSSQVGPMGTYGQANQQIQQVGQAAATRINQNATQQFAAADQDLISRGLGNTTIRESARRGVADDRERAHQENDESIARQRSGLLERQAGLEFQAGVNEIDTALSRQTQYPDPSLFANLISQAASQNPGERQQISIGPGSSSYGSQFRSISSGGGGGGGGSQGRGGGSGGGGGGGVRTTGRRPSSPPGGGQGSRYATTGSGTAAPPIASYGNAPAGNVVDPLLGGRVFGANVPAGTTYQGQTGSGQPIYSGDGGTITNDPTQGSLSDYMRPGTGFISSDSGTFTANADGVGPAATNQAQAPGQSTGGTSGVGEAVGGEVQNMDDYVYLNGRYYTKEEYARMTGFNSDGSRYQGG